MIHLIMFIITVVNTTINMDIHLNCIKLNNNQYQIRYDAHRNLERYRSRAFEILLLYRYKDLETQKRVALLLNKVIRNEENYFIKNTKYWHYKREYILKRLHIHLRDYRQLGFEYKNILLKLEIASPCESGSLALETYYIIKPYFTTWADNKRFLYDRIAAAAAYLSKQKIDNHFEEFLLAKLEKDETDVELINAISTIHTLKSYLCLMQAYLYAKENRSTPGWTSYNNSWILYKNSLLMATYKNAMVSYPQRIKELFPVPD